MKGPFDAVLKVCEQPNTEIRFKFKDGDWEIASGPEFLARLKVNKSGGVDVGWVVEKRPATNGRAK